MTSVLTRNGRLRVWVVPTLVVLIVVCAAAAMLIGRFSVSLEDVVAALRARFWGGAAVSPRVNSVVFDLRAPRIIVAILIGGGLSVAGASFQSLFSNPLATPDTLGVAAGTCVGAVIALLLDWNLIGVQAAALAAGLATMAFTTAISRTRTGAFNVITLVLGGVIVSALANAVLSLLKLTADPTSQLPEITYWLMGSLAAVTYHQIALGAPFFIVLLRRTGERDDQRRKRDLHLSGRPLPDPDERVLRGARALAPGDPGAQRRRKDDAATHHDWPAEVG